MNPILNYNLNVDQGMDFSKTFNVIEIVSDSTFVSKVRNLYSNSYIADLTVQYISNTEIEVSATNETMLIPNGKHKYDIVEQKSNGQKIKVLEGLFTVRETISL